jgi:hypothetical protein
MAGQDTTPVWERNRAGIFLSAMNAASPTHRHHGTESSRNECGPSAKYAANTRPNLWPAWAITACGASAAALLVAVIFI